MTPNPNPHEERAEEHRPEDREEEEEGRAQDHRVDEVAKIRIGRSE